MPCFTSNLASGVQIYLATSFFFTLNQSMALRNETMRDYMGLPSLSAKPPEPVIANHNKKMMRLQSEAREARKKEEEQKRKRNGDISFEGGEAEIVGMGSVLAHGATASFKGKYRPSSIMVNNESNQHSAPTTTEHDLEMAPLSVNGRERLAYVSDMAMEAANKGDKSFQLYKRVVIADPKMADNEDFVEGKDGANMVNDENAEKDVAASVKRKMERRKGAKKNRHKKKK
mmetsp:Transcript_32078/g.39037  ORF Transcript_32078/g.39037 Transcript_32078/m.39037 type:complete len:230 (+) Transcript_32078:1038-1727(+)